MFLNGNWKPVTYQDILDDLEYFEENGYLIEPEKQENENQGVKNFPKNNVSKPSNNIVQNKVKEQLKKLKRV